MTKISGSKINHFSNDCYEFAEWKSIHCKKSKHMRNVITRKSRNFIKNETRKMIMDAA